jgi:hypothetical protein
MRYEYNPLDLWPYVLISFLFLVLHVTRKPSGDLIIFAALLIFCVLRYDVGWDYLAYIEESKEVFRNPGESRFEPLGGLIIYIAGYLEFFPIIFIFFSIATLGIYYIAINRYSTNRTMSWLVFYSMPLFFFASLSTLRQSLAVAIVFYSYHLVLTKKYLHFAIATILAIMFHESAIVGILLLPLIIFSIDRIACAGLLAVSFFLSSSIEGLISNYSSELDLVLKIQTYITLDQPKSTLLQYLYNAIGITNLIFYRRLVATNPLNRKYISLVSFGLFAFNILSFEPVTAQRISTFFLIFMIYLIPDYKRIWSSGVEKLAGHGLFCLLIAMTFFYLYIYINAYQVGVLEKISFIPYRFWFNNL